MRGALIGVVAAALVLSACSLLEDPVPETPDTPPSSVAEFGSTLEQLGIEVVDGASPDPASTPLVVSEIEALHLGAEIEHGNGMLGASLDAVIPMPPEAPPFSYLIAAWLDLAQTPRARTAAAWFPEDTDWSRAPDLAYPRATIYLFVADNIEAAGKDLPKPKRTLVGLSNASLTEAPCTLVKDQFTSLLTGIFNALRIDPAGVGTGAIAQVSGFLAGLWNHAVSLAEGVVRGLITTLTEPILIAIAEGVAIALIVVRISSYLFGYSPEVRAVPDEFTMPGFPDDPLSGSWELVRDPRYEQVDKPLKDCVRQLPGKPELPPVFAVGTPVQWTTSQTPTANTELLTYDQVDFTTIVPPDEGRIALPFTSGPDTEEGEYDLGLAVATARLQRSELTALHGLADRVLTQAINSIDIPNAGINLDQVLKDALKAKLAPLQTELKANIAKAGESVFIVSGTGRALIRHRQPKPPEPGGALPCWWGTWRMQQTPQGLPADYWRRWSFVITDDTFSMRLEDFRNVVPNSSLVGYTATWRGGTSYTALQIAGRGIVVDTPSRQMSPDFNGATWGFDGLPLRFGLITNADKANQYAFGVQFNPRRFQCLDNGARLRVTGIVNARYPFVYTLARTG